MATDVLSLFNMPTQEQLGRSYLEGMLTSPQQLGAQGLLQQVVSLGGNAGAGLGYGVGRLMGGMTADEVRAKGIDDAMRSVQSMGLTSDAEMYGALSQELARRGLTQDALKARDAGLKAAQTEQSMKTEQARLDIAQKELGLRQAQDARAAEKLPLELDQLRSSLEKDRQSMMTTEQKLAEALSFGDTAAAAGYQRQLDTYKKEIDFKEREFKLKEQQLRQQGERLNQDKLQGRLGIYTFTDSLGKTTQIPLGNGVGNKIIGTATGKAYTLPEWEATGYTTEFNAYEKKFNPKADTGGDNKGGNKNIKGVLESIYGGGQAQQVQPQPIPVQPQAPVSMSPLDQALEKELQEMTQGKRFSFSPEVGAYYQQKRAEQKAVERQQQEAYLEAERQRQLRGQR